MLLIRALIRLLNRKDSCEVDYQRIQEIATEVNGQFAKDYSIWFKEFAHRQVEGEGNDPKSEFHLISAPDPRRPIKTGTLRKLGNNVKNWKSRYFVIMNKADNYYVAYYEDSSKSKEKGRIDCSGYIVEPFNAEEERLYGPHGFKLSHTEDAKRTWYLRTDATEELEDWMAAFVLACRKSVSDVHLSSLKKNVFAAALRSTKAAYGYFGLCHVHGTETEALLQFTLDVLAREVIDEHFQDAQRSIRTISSVTLPNAPGSAASLAQSQLASHVQAVKSAVYGVVLPIVTSTLTNCHTSSDSLFASFSRCVQDQLATIRLIEREAALVLEDPLHQLVAGLIDDIKFDMCKPLLNCFFEPLAAFYAESVRVISIAITKSLSSGRCTVFSSPERVRVQSSAERSRMQSTDEQRSTVLSAEGRLQAGIDEMEFSIENPGGVIRDVADTLRTKEFAEAEGKLEGSGLTVSAIVQNCVEDVQILARNALFTVGLRSTVEGFSFAEEIGVIVKQLEHDTSRVFLDRLLITLLDALETKVQELIVAPAADKVYSAQNAVSNCPIALHLPCMGERICRQKVSLVVLEMLKPYLLRFEIVLKESDVAGDVLKLLNN